MEKPNFEDYKHQFGADYARYSQDLEKYIDMRINFAHDAMEQIAEAKELFCVSIDNDNESAIHVSGEPLNISAAIAAQMLKEDNVRKIIENSMKLYKMVNKE